MSGWTKAEVYDRRERLSAALVAVAEKLGKRSQTTALMGSAAWGRYDGEPSSTDTKANALYGLGYLQGLRDALLRAARYGMDDRAARLLEAVPHNGRGL